MKSLGFTKADIDEKGGPGTPPDFLNHNPNSVRTLTMTEPSPLRVPYSNPNPNPIPHPNFTIAVTLHSPNPNSNLTRTRTRTNPNRTLILTPILTSRRSPFWSNADPNPNSSPSLPICLIPFFFHSRRHCGLLSDHHSRKSLGKHLQRL